jgi:hypothetical protein
VREASTTNWGIPPHYTPPQVVANTTLQEFVTADFYRRHAAHTQEPVLARIETLLAKDEVRHEMFYEERLKGCLAEDPDAMAGVLAALKEFGMPGAYLLEDYEARRAAMEAAAPTPPSARRRSRASSPRWSGWSATTTRCGCSRKATTSRTESPDPSARRYARR